MTPLDLRKTGTHAFKITWSDQHTSTYPARWLRQHCVCAVCQDELTGEKRLQPESIPLDIEISKADLVGQYAVSFQFSDGHGTGIYTFENLRKICPCCDE